jgi:hypothetical protein
MHQNRAMDADPLTQQMRERSRREVVLAGRCLFDLDIRVVGGVFNPEARMSTPIVAHVHRYIPVPPERVFAYFVDLRNEPDYNRQVRDITKITSGPVGIGTEFRGEHIGFGSVSWRVTEFQAPRHVVIEGTVGDGTYRWRGDLERAPGGTWFNGDMEWEPARPRRGVRWLMRLALQLNARRAFRKMAQVLARERRAARAPPTASTPNQ